MSMMLRRQMMIPKAGGGGLPAEYQQVEYIQSTSGGGQYIDTGYTPVQGDAFHAEFMLVNSAQYSAVFSAGTEKQIILLMNSSIKAFVQYFSSGSAAQVSFSTIAGIWSAFAIDGNGNFTLNESTGTKAYEAALTDDSTLWLFKRRNNSSPFSGRIRAFTVTNSGTQKLNLIPCYRKADNEPGMYDTVSGNFFTNAGSGDFIIPT